MTHNNIKRAAAHAHHARQLSIPIVESPTTAAGEETTARSPTTAPAPPTTAPAPPPTSQAPPPPPPTTAPAPPPVTVAAPPPSVVIPPTTSTTSIPNRTTTILSTASTQTSAVVRTPTTSSVLPETTVSSARGASTIFNTILTRVSTPGTQLAASTQTADAGDGSPGAGTVVGAVAGALVGVVVLSGLIGYLFKAKFGKSKDDDDDDPFSRGNFRRESTMLPDEFDDGMSQVSGGRSNGGLGRSDTGSSGPRPPTFIQRHIYNTQPSPSFQPGQIVNPAYYGNTGFPREAPLAGDGGWGVAAQYHQQPASQAGSVYSDNLSRQGTMRSAYEHEPYAHSSNLHGVREEEEDMPSRSGTPVNANVQQAFHHGHDSRNTSTDQSSAGGPAAASIPYRGAYAARNRMSVRNGGFDEYGRERPASVVSDAYGGM